jgi:GrpB-like predicted nucleotidyltransferase (UPF0157 family)
MISGEQPVEIVEYHLHLVPIGSRQWLDAIAFRDYLRTHPTIAAEYETLKRQLAGDFHFDREGYTEAKRPFIDRIIELAREQGYVEREP